MCTDLLEIETTINLNAVAPADHPYALNIFETVVAEAISLELDSFIRILVDGTVLELFNDHNRDHIIWKGTGSRH